MTFAPPRDLGQAAGSGAADFARIDWSVYARTDRYYIKRFQAETNLTAMLLVDLSRSMDYPPPECVC